MSNPRPLGQGPEWPGIAGRHLGPLDTSASLLGQLVDPEGHRTRSPGSRESWSIPQAHILSTPRGLGYSPELPGTAGQPSGPSVPGPSHPGRLVDTAVPPTRPQDARDSWSIQRDIGHRPESAETGGRPRDLRPEPESPGRVGRPRGRSDQGKSRSGQLVDSAKPRTWDHVSRGFWSTPRRLGPGTLWAGIAG